MASMVQDTLEDIKRFQKQSSNVSVFKPGVLNLLISDLWFPLFRQQQQQQQQQMWSQNLSSFFFFFFFIFSPVLHFTQILSCFFLVFLFSPVASSICQEGQSERTFLIFPLFLYFFWFSPSFSWFLAIFLAVKGALYPPWLPSGNATLYYTPMPLMSATLSLPKLTGLLDS